MTVCCKYANLVEIATCVRAQRCENTRVYTNMATATRTFPESQRKYTDLQLVGTVHDMAEAAAGDRSGEAPEAKPEAKQYYWERLPDMPTERAYSVGGYCEGKLYVVGKHFDLLVHPRYPHRYCYRSSPTSLCYLCTNSLTIAQLYIQVCGVINM